jgi:hypothetical protein
LELRDWNLLKAIRKIIAMATITNPMIMRTFFISADEI